RLNQIVSFSRLPLYIPLTLISAIEYTVVKQDGKA
ncbi:MAG: hypothetical protein ACI85U_001653, partial [Candidatus Promineifilaceae bacterium]